MRLEQLPIPELEAGEVLVKIECSTLCGSDLHTIKGLRQEKCPSILGHESVGFVVGIGDMQPCDASGEALQCGDRVTWSTTISCGACDRCRAGWTQKCRTLSKYGHAVAEGRQALCGGLAEYILLRPGTAIVKVPTALAAEVVSPANCATATVACAMRPRRTSAACSCAHSGSRDARSDSGRDGQESLPSSRHGGRSTPHRVWPWPAVLVRTK